VQRKRLLVKLNGCFDFKGEKKVQNYTVIMTLEEQLEKELKGKGFFKRRKAKQIKSGKFKTLIDIK
jgi:hypothetical protein